MAPTSGNNNKPNAMVLEDTAGLPIVETARMRWLTSEEIVSVLTPPSFQSDHDEIQQHPRNGIAFMRAAPSSAPPSGWLLLFDLGDDETNFDIGNDGHDWIRKTNNNDDMEILEDRVRLRYGGRDRISACYVHSAKESTFHRRAYRLIDHGDETVKSDNLVLVHYLDTFKAYKVSAVFADHVTAAATKNAARERKESNADEILEKATKKGEAKAKMSAPPQSYDDGTMDILWSMVYDEDDNTVAEGNNELPAGAPSIQEAADIAIQKHISNALETQLTKAVDDTVMDIAGDIDEDVAFVDDEDLRVAVERAMMSGGGEEEDAQEVKPVKKVESALVSALEDIISPELERDIAATMQDVLAEGVDENSETVSEITPSNAPLGPVKAAEIAITSFGDKSISSGSHALPITPLPEIVDFTPTEHCMDFENNKTRIVITTSAAVPILPPDDPPHRWILVAAFIETQATTTKMPLFARVAMSPVKRLSPFSFKCTCPQDIVCSGDRAIILLGLRVLDESDDFQSCKSTAFRVAAKVCIEAEWNVALDVNKDVKTAIYSSSGQQIPRPTFYAPAGGGNVQILTQFSEDLFKYYKSGSADTTGLLAANPPRLAEAVMKKETEGGNGKHKKSMSEQMDVDVVSNLPAPASTMAAVGAALPTLAQNPPEVALGSKVEVIGRKRVRAMKERDEEDPPLTPFADANEVATDWVTNQTPADNDMTVGESVDRHCKIRFVERLANATVVAADDEDLNNLADPSAKQSSTDELILLNDKHFEKMTDEELDLLVDNVLVRFVESLVETCTTEAELRKELDAPGLSGFTLLHFASLYGLNSLVPLLLSRGANPNVTTSKVRLTPLHLACGAGHKQVVDVLIRYGANADAQDAYNLWPADHALRNGFDIIAQFLYKTLGTLSGSESSDDNSVNSGFHSSIEEEKRMLVQSAFKDLSLRDKLGLNMFYLKKVQQKQRGEGSKSNDKDDMDDNNDRKEDDGECSSDNGDGAEDTSKETFRFIDEKDRESLKVAMSLMSTEERAELEKNGPYADVRKWMLQGNYKALREAAKQLDERKRRDEISKNRKKSSKSSKSTSLSNAKLSQALSMLVMRKNLLETERKEKERATTSRTASMTGDEMSD